VDNNIFLNNLTCQQSLNTGCTKRTEVQKMWLERAITNLSREIANLSRMITIQLYLGVLPISLERSLDGLQTSQERVITTEKQSSGESDIIGN